MHPHFWFSESVYRLFSQAELVDDLLPPGVFNLVTGPGEEVGDELARDPRVTVIGFIGSTRTGRRSRA